ncbi:DUF2750 domain-containing protein [Paenibacillus popilliae]|uniref:DUF2750 domain-containing protein n=1 Tax=Paenibacillus popilliae TaxID=78057 RepID=A0ABY3AMC4_PAEPP|nr:DUF2750 domain-containing protein [Paenibacillus sp. SDF0028]TQR39922.1 DUF2750 domain-containing protein [Paenibacillus sp. SDF0028]TQR41710.1 DUF2750 domain-containing protein [Paenibacillus sp. SDF0028]
MGKGFESSPEFKAMIKRSARDRYIYSVKRIADWEEAWSLKLNDGFVTTSDKEGNLSMPIWPFKEYAMKCIEDEWENCQTQKIHLDTLLDELLPNLSEEGMHVVVFKVPEDPDVVRVSADDFKNNLLYECSQYE